MRTAALHPKPHRGTDSQKGRPIPSTDARTASSHRHRSGPNRHWGLTHPPADRSSGGISLVRPVEHVDTVTTLGLGEIDRLVGD